MGRSVFRAEVEGDEVVGALRSCLLCVPVTLPITLQSRIPILESPEVGWVKWVQAFLGHYDKVLPWQWGGLRRQMEE